MEKTLHEGDEKNLLDPKSEKICLLGEKSTVLSPTAQKSGGVGSQNLDLKFASHTPEKLNQPSLAKLEGGEGEVPERFAHVTELFGGIICSLRLLRLRKKSPTFQSVSTQVEVLTKRKLSSCHLAQMKYIFPEAIQIEKILVHDKKTLCMKPDMKIELAFDVVEGHRGQSEFATLHGDFAHRLVNYFAVHPEAADIPEATLPDPFNRNTMLGDNIGDIEEAAFTEIASITEECQPTALQHELYLKPSHLNPSFTRHFSDKKVLAPMSLVASCNKRDKNAVIEEKSEFPEPGSQSDSVANLEAEAVLKKESPGTCSEVIIINPLAEKPVNSQTSVSSSVSDSPLPKLHSSADGFTVETPAQSIPKRAMPSSDVKHNAVAIQKQTLSSQPVKRSLDFFRSSEGDEHAMNSTVNKSGFPDSFQHHISQTGDSLAQPLKIKNSQNLPTESRRMTQPDLVHQQISVHLPELVSLIHSIFLSVNYAPITKEELVYKILINSFDFIERREVDEHIEVLEKLVPDWICNKLTPGGDDLYNINKMLDLDCVCARITSV